jgi:hypothetical protein
LSDCRFAVPGVTSIATSLKGNEALEFLHMSGVKATNKGAVVIGEALSTNKSLRGLNLANCSITDEGVNSMIQGLQKNIANSNIRYIDLDGNPVSQAKVEELKRLIRIGLVTYGGGKGSAIPDRLTEDTPARPMSAASSHKKMNDYLRNALAFKEEMRKEATIRKSKYTFGEEDEEDDVMLSPTSRKNKKEYREYKKQKEEIEKLKRKIEEEAKKGHSKLEQKEQKLEQKENIVSQKEKEIKEKEKLVEQRMKELEEKEKQLQSMMKNIETTGSTEEKKKGLKFFKRFIRPTSASSVSSEESDAEQEQDQIPEESGFDETIRVS